ncbi:MAG: hypothetical protein KDK72_06405, partial [Chlamydiia bacterium]|nr:hypothetical protein [Chlamydiia bacterium]
MSAIASRLTVENILAMDVPELRKELSDADEKSRYQFLLNISKESEPIDLCKKVLLAYPVVEGEPVSFALFPIISSIQHLAANFFETLKNKNPNLLNALYQQGGQIDQKRIEELFSCQESLVIARSCITPYLVAPLATEKFREFLDRLESLHQHLCDDVKNDLLKFLDNNFHQPCPSYYYPRFAAFLKKLSMSDDQIDKYAEGLFKETLPHVPTFNGLHCDQIIDKPNEELREMFRSSDGKTLKTYFREIYRLSEKCPTELCRAIIHTFHDDFSEEQKIAFVPLLFLVETTKRHDIRFEILQNYSELDKCIQNFVYSIDIETIEQLLSDEKNDFLVEICADIPLRVCWIKEEYDRFLPTLKQLTTVIPEKYKKKFVQNLKDLHINETLPIEYANTYMQTLQEWEVSEDDIFECGKPFQSAMTKNVVTDDYKSLQSFFNNNPLASKFANAIISSLGSTESGRGYTYSPCTKRCLDLLLSHLSQEQKDELLKEKAPYVIMALISAHEDPDNIEAFFDQLEKEGHSTKEIIEKRNPDRNLTLLDMTCLEGNDTYLPYLLKKYDDQKLH